MASAVRQKTRLLPEINVRNQVKAGSLKGKEVKESAYREKSKSATVTEDDIAQFRKSQYQNLCVSMLREGFHHSFAELFSLLQRWNTSRLKAGPDSALWYQRSLEEQPCKLQTLKEHLTRAEAAQRADQHVEVYDSYLALAKFFSETEDSWLRQHFYQRSLEAARKIKTDSGKHEAEANAHLGQTYLEQGDLDLAREHFEAFHHLAVGQSWREESGHKDRLSACEGLCRMYILLAQRHLQAEEHMPAIEILTKAYEVAREAGDRRMEGEAVYKLGLAYQSMGDQKAAKKFLDTFMEISTALRDPESLGTAYKAMAKYLESKGQVSESMQCLQKYAEVSRENHHGQRLQDACMCLGSLHISRGQYSNGCECFHQAFELACKLDSVPLLHKAQVYVGISRAHAMLRAYGTHVEDGGPQSISSLMCWKDRREDKFKKQSQEATE